MLWIGRLLAATSNDADGNGRSRASASTRSTRSRTPSTTALSPGPVPYRPQHGARQSCLHHRKHRNGDGPAVDAVLTSPAGGTTGASRRDLSDRLLVR